MAAANSRRLRRIAISVAAIALAAAGVFALLKVAPQRGVVATTKAESADEDPRTRAQFETAFNAGIEAFKQGNAHAAMVAFESATKLRPSSSQAHVNLGFALVEMKVWERARDHFTRALQLNPDQFNAYYGIAEALEGEGDIDQAASAMKTYLYFAPQGDPFRRRAEAALWEWGVPISDAVDDRAGETTIRYDGSLHALSARDLTGEEVSFDGYRGKTVVLNVWASWCPPCRRELPALNALSKRLDAKRYAVVGVSVDDNPDYIKEYLRRIDVDFPNLWDKNQTLSADVFDLDAYPTTFLVSANGKIEKKIVGFRDWTSSDMINEIKAVARDGAAAGKGK